MITQKKGRTKMKTDIEIAQEAEMLHIKDVAAQYGITEDDLGTLRQSTRQNSPTNFARLPIKE